MPIMYVDFWKPMDSNGFFDLSQPLQDAGSKPPKERIIPRNPEHSDYLVTVAKDGGSLFGSAARILRQNLPGKANLNTGEIKELGFLIEEGLAQEVGFRYSPKLKVLAIQRNFTFRISGFAALLMDLSGTTFAFEPVLRKDKWQRFNRMQRIGKLDVKIAHPAHHPDFSDTIPSLGQLLDDASETIGALSVRLTLSMERVRKRTMAKNIVRKLVQAFSKEDENVYELSASGAAEDEKSETVDFIKDRLVFRDGVEYSDNSRRINPATCQQLLKRAIAEHQDYLKSLL